MIKKRNVILLAILLLCLSSLAQQQDGSVLERRVTINQEKQSLISILDQLSWQAGVFFSYDAALINSEKTGTIDATNKSLYTILNNLFPSNQFQFSERENQIIIAQREKLEITEEVKDTIPIKYFFLRSNLLDAKKEDPIKYASISIFNKPIGTISNNDGDFLLKIHPDNIRDTVVISCMGYSQIYKPAYEILDEDVIEMNPITIRIREVKVTATTPAELLKNVHLNLEKNYSSNTKLMSAFYRETIKQDGDYINVSEAVMEILKASYSNTFRTDLVRLIKGRRSPDVKPFQWINFKLQGGPFTITKLDAIKTMESFIDKEFQELYKYNISNVIWYNEHPVYVLNFQPISDMFFPSFVGKMFIHRESFAIVHVSFRFNKSGLKKAESTMIKKKPRGVKAKPIYVQYTVDYQQYNDAWYLAKAQASVKFKVRSRRDKLNSEYHSVSDLLITDINSTDLKKFHRTEQFTQRDVFVEMIDNYDQIFWENYNIIKPDEDLRNAFKTSNSN